MSSLVNQIEFLTRKRRLIPSAALLFEIVSTMTSVTDAVRQMGILLKEPVYEMWVPKENKWVPYVVWDGMLCFEVDGISWPPNSSPVLKKNTPLYNAILATMLPWDMMVVGDIVAQYVPEHTDCFGTKAGHMRLIKAVLVVP